MLLKVKVARRNWEKEDYYFNLRIADCIFLKYNGKYLRLFSCCKRISQKGRRELRVRRWISRNSITCSFYSFLPSDIVVEEVEVKDLINIFDYYKDYFRQVGFKFNLNLLEDVDCSYSK